MNGVLSVMMVVAFAGGAAAQEPTPSEQAAEAPGLTGTWVMLLQGHQVGLEIEQNEKVLMGTLYIMGRPVDGR
jgi:hypothetical protein